MQFLDQSGFRNSARLRGTKWIMGICGGYQMLGLQIDDPHGMESGGSEKGLGMLPMTTVLEGDKRLVRKDYHGMNEFKGLEFNAYEIHLGRSEFGGNLPNLWFWRIPTWVFLIHPTGLWGPTFMGCWKVLRLSKTSILGFWKTL